MEYKINVLSLFLIVTMLFCEACLLSFSANAFGQQIGYLIQSDSESAQAFEQTDLTVLEEYCTPELIGARVFRGLFGGWRLIKNNIKTRNLIGRILLAVFTAVFLFKLFLKQQFQYVFQQDITFVSEILSFIHQKDGKK